MHLHAELRVEKRPLDYYEEVCRLRGRYMDDCDGRFLKAEAIRISDVKIPYRNECNKILQQRKEK